MLRPPLPLQRYTVLTTICWACSVGDCSRFYFITIDSALSFVADITFGVSQGSSRAPIFYSLHMLHLATSWISGKQHRGQSVACVKAARAPGTHLWFCFVNRLVWTQQVFSVSCQRESRGYTLALRPPSRNQCMNCGCQGFICSQMWTRSINRSIFF